MSQPQTSAVRAHALRLSPGQDLRQELQAYAQAHGLRAAAVLTTVGSLTTVSLRLANQEGATTRHGHFEIISLVGTVSVNGSHLHVSVADSTGQTFGGHLLDGCRVYTTAEVVLGELPELDFTRAPDPVTTYRELRVKRAAKTAKP
ncbi:MAG: DNA-binding protein [Hymenobacteraceae bacterium]|nr:DNA-binding protein [Hymenobacteraceae bacterium]